MSAKAFFVRLNNKIYKTLGKTKYYETKYGVKVYNRPKGKKAEEITETFLLPPNSVILGVDGLKDKYTSVGKDILNSPHATLIKASEKEDFTDCDYVKREKVGALDGRDCLSYSTEYHLANYKNTLSKLDGDYPPVKVYEADGKYYVSDGKHRAAILALGGKDVKCVKVEFGETTLDYMKNILAVMNKTPDVYKKNIELVKSILRKYGKNFND